MSKHLHARKDLDKIFGRQVVPCQLVPAPATCETSCGPGYVQCTFYPHCFNPSAGEICCGDGTYCPAGSYCSNNGCCDDSWTLEECGATEKLTTLPAPPASTAAQTVYSTSTSAYVASSVQTYTPSPYPTTPTAPYPTSAAPAPPVSNTTVVAPNPAGPTIATGAGSKKQTGVAGALVGVALALAMVIKAFAVQAFYIPSQSMENTLKVGDRVLVNKIVYHTRDIKRGDVIAVWGCGPVGQMAIRSAWLLGAERVIAIDRIPYRLQMAAEKTGAIPINYEETSVLETLNEMTGGRGPDKCIDAVGMEAHAHGLMYAYDRTKQALMAELDRPIALREAVMACRSGGTVSVIGVYAGFIDKFPMGSLMNRSLTIKSGQCHVHRYLQPLLERIQKGEIDPSFVITHHMPLDQAPEGYAMFRNKQDNCEKIVLKPN